MSLYHTHALTFGVELEFIIAFNESFRKSQPEKQEVEEETIHFANHDIDVMYETIAKTLTNAGYPAELVALVGDMDTMEEGAPSQYTAWQVGHDYSIHTPPQSCDTKIRWMGVEVTSPIYYFSAESITAVIEVCNILKRSFKVQVNESTGLHIHVGNGHEHAGKFSFSTLRNLYALLWAFEPQLDTLHPPHRQDGDYCNSLRARTTPGSNGETLRPLEGILKCLEAKDIEDLYELNDVVYRTQAYNFQNALRLEVDGEVDPCIKQTVEFRQHEGTLDGERIQAWILTVVGLVQYAQNAEFDPVSFRQLLLTARYEGIGREKEATLCEGGFTIIDLLKILGLFQPALFYLRRGLYGPYRPWYYWPGESEDGEISGAEVVSSGK